MEFRNHELMTPLDEAQFQLLGGMLIGRITPDDVRVTSDHIETTSETTFYQKAFKAVEMLHRNNEPVAMDTVLARMGINLANETARERLKRVQALAYGREDYTNQERYVLEQSAVRRARNEVERALTEGLSTVQDVSELSSTIEAFADVTTSLEGDKQTAFEQARNIVMNGQQGGVTSNFPSITRNLGGYVEGRLYYVGGRSGTGKTQFVINEMLHNISKGDSHSIFFSMEMTKVSLIMRMAALAANIDQKEVNRPSNVAIDKKDEEKLLSALNRLEAVEDRFTIYEDKMTTQMIQTKIQRAKRLYPDKKIIAYIDYLGIMPDQNKARDLREKITNIAQGLQTVVKTTRVPIVALSQLTRESAKTQDKVPRLTDLKESGAIEETADAVILLNRPSEHIVDETKKKEYERVMEIYIAKNRYGKTCKIVADWNGRTGRIKEDF